MMTIRRSYLAVLAILLASSALLFVTRQSDYVSVTTQIPDTRSAATFGNTASPSTNTITTTAEDESRNKPQAPLPGTGRHLDWNKYPGTLDSQIHRVLDSHDGQLAMDVAAKLWECKVATLMLDPAYSSPSEDPGIRAATVERTQKYQRINADCQTIAGDRDQWRLRVLDVAIEQKIAGAAVESFNQGVRRPDVLQSVVQDAQAGDIKSLTNIAYHKAETFDISADTQRASRYALEIASKDPVVGEMVRPYLRTAEIISVPVGGEAKPKFDDSNLSDEVRKEGKAIAERLISRIKRGGQ